MSIPVQKGVIGHIQFQFRCFVNEKESDSLLNIVAFVSIVISMGYNPFPEETRFKSEG